jgi:hypothetical protein
LQCAELVLISPNYSGPSWAVTHILKIDFKMDTHKKMDPVQDIQLLPYIIVGTNFAYTAQY